MKNEATLNPVMKTTGEVKSALGVYYSVKELHGLSDPHDSNNKMNFLRLLNLNFFLRPSIDEINFVYNFLKKSYKEYFVNINENLNVQYFHWFGDDDRQNIAIDEKSAIELIEEKIEDIINSVLSKNKNIENMMKRDSLWTNLLMSFEENKKVEFIFKNRNSYKGNLKNFIDLKINYVSNDDHKMIKVPSFLNKVNIENDFQIYAVRNGKVLPIEGAYIFGAKINHKNNTLSIRMEIPDIYPNVYNFPFVTYNEKEDKFFFDMTNELYGTYEEAKVEIKNKINQMKSDIEKMEENIAA